MTVCFAVCTVSGRHVRIQIGSTFVRNVLCHQVLMQHITFVVINIELKNEDFENDMRCIITIISSKTINSLCVSVIYLFLFNPNSFYCVLPTAFPLIAVWFLL